MPILHEGVYVCARCKKEFEWVHFESERQPMSRSVYTVESIPLGRMVYHFSTNEDGSHNVKMNCPHCQHDNHFVYIEND